MNRQTNNLQKTFNLAVEHHQAGRFEEAESLYQNILRLSPAHADTLYLLGVLSSQLGKYETATQLIREVTRISPDFAEAHYNLGSSFGEQNKLDESIAAYRRAIAINPNYAEALFSLGKALAFQDKPKEAADAYQRAITINPDNAEAHCNLGNILVSQGKQEEAVPSYRSAIAIDFNYTEALFNLSVALKDQGRLDEAIVYCRRVLEIDPSAKAHYNLGTVLHGQGKLNEAEASYRRALELDPDNISAQFTLAMVTGKKPETAPPEYVKNLFDGYSAQFDQHLVENLEYQTPKLLRQALAETVNDDTRFRNAIDLGCGTGLGGIEFRSAADHLCGIDISKKMTTLAQEKNIYDNLRVGDMVELLNETDEQYDLVFATDVFGYVGNLQPVFRSVEKCTSSGAYFVFSTENSNKEDYTLSTTGRFAHSRSHIESLASERGFAVETCRPANIRKEQGQWVIGNLFVLRKTNKATN